MTDPYEHYPQNRPQPHPGATQPEPARAATLDARELTPEQVTAIYKALDNARMHIDGSAKWFSAREKTAVLWQLRNALTILALAPRPGDGDPAGE